MIYIYIYIYIYTHIHMYIYIYIYIYRAEVMAGLVFLVRLFGRGIAEFFRLSTLRAMKWVDCAVGREPAFRGLGFRVSGASDPHLCNTTESA